MLLRNKSINQSIVPFYLSKQSKWDYCHTLSLVMQKTATTNKCEGTILFCLYQYKKNIEDSYWKIFLNVCIYSI